MNWKRLLLAAAAGTLSASPVARADSVGPTLSQDQANRLSLFHDYGLNAVGNANSVAVPANVGNPNDFTFGPVAGSPGGGLITSLLPPSIGSTDTAGPNRPFDVTFSPFAGYDANPDARRIPRGGAFAGGDLGAAYHISDGPDDPIVGQPLRATFAYDVLGAGYEGQVQAADTLQQNLSASVRQTLFDGTLVMTGALSDGFTMEHGEAFLDTFDAGAAGEFFLVPNASIEAGYNFTHLQYFFVATQAAQKPTADRDTFSFKGHLYTLPQRRGATVSEAPDVLTELLRAGLRRVTVDYAHVWNEPTVDTGHDYQYESNRVGIGFDGIAAPPQVATAGLGRYTRDLSFDVDYNHEFQGYEYENSASPPLFLAPKGNTVRQLRHLHRKDGLDVFTFRGNARLFDLPHDLGTVGSYLQWDVIRDGSNVLPRHYNEYVISGGLTYRY